MLHFPSSKKRKFYEVKLSFAIMNNYITNNNVKGVEGGSRSICHKKITDNGFLVLFSNPPLILQNANGLYNFLRFQRGFDIFFQGGGGPTFLGGDPIAYPL